MQGIYVILLAFAALPTGLALQPLKPMSVSDDLSDVRKDAWASFVNILQEAETTEITSKEEFTQLVDKHTSSLTERMQKLRQKRPELTVSPESLLSVLETELSADSAAESAEAELGAGADAGVDEAEDSSGSKEGLPGGLLMKLMPKSGAGLATAATVSGAMHAKELAMHQDTVHTLANGDENPLSTAVDRAKKKVKMSKKKRQNIVCRVAPPLVLFAADRFCSKHYGSSDAIIEAGCIVSLVIPVATMCFGEVFTLLNAQARSKSKEQETEWEMLKNGEKPKPKLPKK